MPHTPRDRPLEVGRLALGSRHDQQYGVGNRPGRVLREQGKALAPMVMFLNETADDNGQVREIKITTENALGEVVSEVVQRFDFKELPPEVLTETNGALRYTFELPVRTEIPNTYRIKITGDAEYEAILPIESAADLL